MNKKLEFQSKEPPPFCEVEETIVIKMQEKASRKTGRLWRLANGLVDEKIVYV